MEKVVIYKELNKFYATSEENYNKRIADKNKILDFSSFASFEEVENYFKEYLPKVVTIRGRT